MEKNFLIKQKNNDMKINKFFLILLAAFSPFLNLKAQQVPVSTQFIYNGYLYNPARAGQNTQYGLAFIDFHIIIFLLDQKILLHFIYLLMVIAPLNSFSLVLITYQ